MQKSAGVFRQCACGSKSTAEFSYDENENKILDLNAANHPIEKFGFSNNFFGSYSELPPYDKVLINIDKAENFVRINLR